MADYRTEQKCVDIMHLSIWLTTNCEYVAVCISLLHLRRKDTKQVYRISNNNNLNNIREKLYSALSLREIYTVGQKKPHLFERR